MSHELTIQTATGARRVFLQAGFYDTAFTAMHAHCHDYAELHLIVDGKASFEVDNGVWQLNAGDVLILPKQLYHASLSADAAVQHTAFQTDCEIDACAMQHFSPAVVRAFFEEIAACQGTGDHTRVAAYLTLFCFALEKKAHVTARPISDSAFLIREFFSNHYAEDVHLCDLARALHLSERQAERLVLACTGHSFRQELTATRMVTAERLMETGELSLRHIAEYVGYRSYAGFWKAWKAYCSERATAGTQMTKGDFT